MVVNAWNEWDPLKHVIVGRAAGTMVQAPEIAVQREWEEHGFPLGTYAPYPEEMTAKADEQLDNFAKILESRGIRVDRPTPLDFSQTVRTPDWIQETMFGCMHPRDLLLPVGNEIVGTSETPAMESLDKHGFEVIPVHFCEVSHFGGGLHSASADVYREGTFEDYFPNQIEGF